VSLRFALAFAGAAIAVVGAAQAQDRPVATRPQVASSVEAPWYERFSVRSEEATAAQGTSATWRVNGRWGVTVDVPQERAAVLSPLAPREETAFGAYFQVNPSIRVGGQVGIARPAQQATTRGPTDPQEPDAAVRIQSAFRF
jgi:hypothetical protein